MKRVAAITLLALPLTGDPAVEAYRQGRYQDALARIEQAQQAGQEMPAERLIQQALAAVGAGSLFEAEVAAETAAARAPATLQDYRDFILASCAYQRCRQAAELAARPEAEPFVYDTAIAHGRQALLGWQRTVIARPDWPEARRNCERVLRLLAQLKIAREEKRKQNERAPQQPPPEKPQPEEPQPPERDLPEFDEPVEPQLDPETLTAAQIQALLQRLEDRQQEKLDLRKQQRKVHNRGMQKDW